MSEECQGGDDKFIEYDLPLKEISEQSAKENEDKYGKISTLHKWWARRPLTPSRATIFSSLISDPEDISEQKKINDLICSIVDWKKTKSGNNTKKIDEAKELIDQESDQSPKVIDPFSGGGAIPLESIRLGCDTIASDYNPVAVLINKAILEWPQAYGIKGDIPEKITLIFE